MRVQSRRTDAFPTTWEIPVGIGLVWLVGVFLALPAGQGAAYALAGRGFAWPGRKFGPSLLGLLTGHPGRGLSPGLRQGLPPVPLVYATIVVVELTLTVVAVVGVSSWWRSVGPYAQFGMAPRHEVTAVLGRGQLMRRRTTIRPDLASQGRPPASQGRR